MTIRLRRFSRLRYLLAGSWQGADGTLPPGDVLASYRVERITWSARPLTL